MNQPLGAGLFWLKLSMSTSTIDKLSQPFVLESRITLHAWPTNYEQAAPHLDTATAPYTFN